MKTLIKYEFLKILRKKSTLIVMAVSLLLTAFLFGLPILQYQTYNQEGVIKGSEGIAYAKGQYSDLAVPLTEEYIAEMIREYQNLFENPDNVGYIPELIEKLGGVDIAFGGIGINGHVAFNEPQDELTGEEFLALKTRVLDISKETRAVNSIGDLNGALDDMPHYCITIGIYEISHARKIRLGCFRDWHRSVVRRTAHGEPTAHFPVSLLQNHPDINLKFTEFVANLPE